MGTKKLGVGKIEQVIAFPESKPLSLAQKKVLELNDGESFILVVHFENLLTDNAERLVRWARTRGIRIMRRKIDHDAVRIWRVESMSRVIGPSGESCDA